MQPDVFRDLAVDSAQTYYKYLEENGRGVSVTQVHSVTSSGRSFLLRLRRKLAYGASDALDALEFELNGVRYTSEAIRPVEYNNDTAVLCVWPEDRLVNQFLTASPDKITVLTDLKFLVTRVEHWYKAHGASIALPPTPSPLKPFERYLGGDPSDEQLDAIHSALSHPLSYVWGAPGTGKTRFVLSNCVVTYLFNKKKVLLVAPTNNALEQMLDGLLQQFDAANLSRDVLLRLGTPSHAFAARYPECCELSGIDARIQTLEQDAEHIRKCMAYRDFRKKYEKAKNAIPALVRDIAALLRVSVEVEAEREKIFRDDAIRAKQISILRHEANAILAEIQSLQSKQNTFLARLQKRFSPRAYSERQKELERMILLSEHKIDRLNSLVETHDSFDKEMEALSQRIETALSDVKKKKRQFYKLCSFWKPLSTLAQQVDVKDLAEDMQPFDAFCQEMDQTLAEKALLYSPYEGQDDAALAQKLEDIESEIARLSSSTTEERLARIFVLALTADRFLTTFSPDEDSAFQPDHIFMDEAGYCSLIKAAPLLSLHVPVTLLGDHMQLPPICEMDDDLFCLEKYAAVFLWAQSAIHLEEIFDSTSDGMCSAYLDGDPAPFARLKKSDLTKTYRFGKSITDILASSVYSPLFCSATPQGTDIIVIDAPRRPGGKKRENKAEAEAISFYLSDFAPKEYAILSPYRNQVSLLCAELPRARDEERIMTVHASQGREWQTVILSVSDTDNKWFTDSQLLKSRGKMVINTAVSRTKDHLVLVCDYAYWSRQPDQLIGQLVLAGRRVTPSLHPDYYFEYAEEG